MTGAVVQPLLAWYDAGHRDLPWRRTRDPYRIWLSEIMLQQTRVEAVIPYYERFLAACPDVRALAEAPEEVYLKLWEGLGYYSRVRNLHRAAQIVCEAYGGQMPADYARCAACLVSATTRRARSRPSLSASRNRPWTATSCASSRA